MSKEEPKRKYTTVVKKNGNGATIKCYKEYIGRTVSVHVYPKEEVEWNHK